MTTTRPRERKTGRRGGWCGFFLAVALWFAATPAAAVVVDLEIVLAVDVSSSVDNIEYDIQMDGYAQAFRDPKLHAAIAAAGKNGIAVCMIQWADAGMAQVAVDWVLVRNPAEAAALGDRFASTERRWAGYLTGIGAAIDMAAQLIESNAYEGHRKVIDVSGDGTSNHGVPPHEARDRVVARGVTINGLPILRFPRIDGYYRDNVIGGKDSFMEPVKGFRDIGEAILRKLIREIGGEPVS